MSIFTLAALGIAFVGLPQLIKTWRAKSAVGVAFPTYALLVFLQWTMFVHAIEIRDVPFMITNGLGGSINTCVFLLLWRYRQP